MPAELDARIAEARAAFLRRLGSVQKSLKEFKDQAEYFGPFLEAEADRRLLSCRRFSGRYCEAWPRRSRIPAARVHNYELSAADQQLPRDPGLFCAACPLHEPKETR